MELSPENKVKKTAHNLTLSGRVPVEWFVKQIIYDKVNAMIIPIAIVNFLV